MHPPYRIGLYVAAALSMGLLAADHGNSWLTVFDLTCFGVFVAYALDALKKWWAS